MDGLFLDMCATQTHSMHLQCIKSNRALFLKIFYITNFLVHARMIAESAPSILVYVK